MAWYDRFLRTKAKGKPVKLPARFSTLNLGRTGQIITLEDDNRTYIQRGYQDNDVVFSIVDRIAKSAANVKWCVKDKATGKEVLIPLLDELMKKPLPGKTWSDIIQDAITQKLLTGNAFFTGEYGTGLNSDYINAMYIVPTEQMQILQTDDQRGIRAYRPYYTQSTSTEIPASEVLHLRTPNPDYDETDNWQFGQSPFRATRSSISIYNEAQASIEWYVQNKGAQRAIMLKDADGIEMAPEEIDRLKARLRDAAQGSKNVGNLPILNAEMDTLDISSPFKDLMLMEIQNHAAMQICSAIHYPCQLYGLKDATYQNAKEAKKALWENTILPEVNEIKDGFNRWLAPVFGDNIYFDIKLDHIDALQDDKLTRFKAIKEAAGAITNNEYRLLAGLEPTDEPWGDERYVGFVQAVMDESSDSEDEQKWNDYFETD